METHAKKLPNDMAELQEIIASQLAEQEAILQQLSLQQAKTISSVM